MLRKCIANYLDIDVSEFTMNYCKARNNKTGKVEPIIYFVESLENGAGYTSHLGSSQLLIKESILDTLTMDSDYVKSLLDKKHSSLCETSCYDCLQDYYNRTEHLILDWRLGLDLAQISKSFCFVPSLAVEYWKNQITKSLETMEEMKVIDSHCFLDNRETWIVKKETEEIFLVHPLWSNQKISSLASRIGMADSSARIIRNYHLDKVE